MPPKANTLSSMPPELIKRIVEEAGKKEPRRPLTTDIPRTTIDPNVYRFVIENGDDFLPQHFEHTEAERGRILKDAATYINRKYNTPAKYNAASTSKQINNDMKPKAKAKPRAKSAPKLQPKPKPKPKAKAKARINYWNNEYEDSD